MRTYRYSSSDFDSAPDGVKSGDSNTCLGFPIVGAAFTQDHAVLFHEPWICLLIIPTVRCRKALKHWLHFVLICSTTCFLFPGEIPFGVCIHNLIALFLLVRSGSKMRANSWYHSAEGLARGGRSVAASCMATCRRSHVGSCGLFRRNVRTLLI